MSFDMGDPGNWSKDELEEWRAEQAREPACIVCGAEGVSLRPDPAHGGDMTCAPCLEPETVDIKVKCSGCGVLFVTLEDGQTHCDAIEVDDQTDVDAGPLAFAVHCIRSGQAALARGWEEWPQVMARRANQHLAEAAFARPITPHRARRVVLVQRLIDSYAAVVAAGRRAA